MKKKLIRGYALLFCVLLIAIGCENDEDSIPVETSKNVNLKANDVIGEFNAFLVETYGTGKYSIEENGVKVTDRSDEFYVYKVTVNSDVEGYILETRRDGNFYYEHNVANKSVTEYNYDSVGRLNMSLTDMSGNPYYNLYGFNPILPPDPALVSARFWGYEITYGPCGPNSNGDGGYSAGVYAIHYVFWIGGEEKPVKMFSPSGTGRPVRAYVDCVNGVPGIYFGDIMF